ncbi:MAG TPA: nucleotide sugar dehydrogenase [Acidimicrobiales bacterium]|jgi:nucleotide sugar dehydrogenase|nr:nucleotide sugar dehydrogenase [Acidimicrobiales bacterium]
MGDRSRRVVVVGQGYVGLPLAMRAVEVGYTVVGFDTSEDRVKRLKSGESYVQDITSDAVDAALASGRYLPTTTADDCADFDVAVVTVPTPLTQGVPDLSHIEAAAESLGPLLRVGATVILESTTYPGTTEELMVPILERGSGLAAGRQFHVGYSPERIDPGNPIFHLWNTPKVVSGIDADSLGVVDAFYRDLVEQTVPVSSTRVAEMSKLLENTFRHVNIALVNELAMYAGQLGVSVWEAIDAAASKPFGYMRFTPGPGVGGHCLPVDPSFLSWKVKQSLGDDFRIVELANDVNEHMPSYVARRIVESLNRVRKAVNGSRILVVGLAYKKNTGDVRESPAVALCAALHGLGADVRVVDGYVPEHEAVSWPRIDLSDEELDAADLVVIVTDHDDVDYDRITRRAKLVFDTRRRVRPGPTVEYL